MSYEAFVGHRFPPFSVDVDSWRLRFFARAVGEQDPLYSDPEAARAAGYPALPAPPTMAYSLLMDAGQPFRVLEVMGIDLKRAVHGEQAFTYHAPVCAGDTLTGVVRIADVYTKKGGALLFIVVDTALRNQHDAPVIDQRSTIVVRQG